jgi:hypothetical protein
MPKSTTRRPNAATRLADHQRSVLSRPAQPQGTQFRRFDVLSWRLPVDQTARSPLLDLVQVLDMALAIANGQMDANTTASFPMLPHYTDPVNDDSADEANGE